MTLYKNTLEWLDSNPRSWLRIDLVPRQPPQSWRQRLWWWSAIIKRMLFFSLPRNILLHIRGYEVMAYHVGIVEGNPRVLVSVVYKRGRKKRVVYVRPQRWSYQWGRSWKKDVDWFDRLYQ